MTRHEGLTSCPRWLSSPCKGRLRTQPRRRRCPAALQMLPDSPPAAVVKAQVKMRSNPPGYHTEWGGLLFFLRLFDRLGLPEIAVTDEILGGRTLERILHRLAISLIPAA